MDMVARVEEIRLTMSVGERYKSYKELTSVINRIPAHSLYLSASATGVFLKISLNIHNCCSGPYEEKRSILLACVGWMNLDLFGWRKLSRESRV
jgi:hypothetical protein